jgi:hypothetical protein
VTAFGKPVRDLLHDAVGDGFVGLEVRENGDVHSCQCAIAAVMVRFLPRL